MRAAWLEQPASIAGSSGSCFDTLEPINFCAFNRSWLIGGLTWSLFALDGNSTFMVRDGLRPPHHEPTPHPCNLRIAALAVSSDDAVATERPPHPGTKKSVPQHGSSAAIPLNPHSRLGRGDGRGTCFYRYRCLEGCGSVKTTQTLSPDLKFCSN